MRDINLLTIFTVASIILAFLFFFYPTVIAPIPYGTFTFLFAMFTCFWVAFRLIKRLQQTPEESLKLQIKTLRNYFLTMGIFFFFDGIAHVGIPALYPNELFASHTHTFSHAFFFLANMFIIRIPVYFFNKLWVNAASATIGVLGIIAIAWRVINTDKLVYIFGPSQAPIVITDQTSGLIFLVTNTLGLLIPGLYIIYKGLKITDESRRRAVLLGLGMIAFFSVGPVIDLMKNQYTQLTIHLIIALSFFLMGAASFYHKKWTSPQEASQSKSASSLNV